MKNKILTLAVLLMFLLTACVPKEANDKVLPNENVQVETVETENTESLTEDEDKKVAVSEQLTVHFIDVGQGDATLIQCGDKSMLIDGGDNDKGTVVQKYLMDNSISSLDYIIATHPDADHVGGLDVVITKFDVDLVLLPNHKADTRTYKDFINAIKYKYVKTEVPKVGNEYSLGEASFKILSVDAEEDNANESSICILLTFGETSYLFGGDIGEETELNILDKFDVSADVFKLNHHGSSYSNCLSFLREVDPEIVVISCGSNNSYGHPHEETMDRIEGLDCEIYRTDEQGSIVFHSDGKSIMLDEN